MESDPTVSCPSRLFSANSVSQNFWGKHISVTKIIRLLVKRAVRESQFVRGVGASESFSFLSPCPYIDHIAIEDATPADIINTGILRQINPDLEFCVLINLVL